MLQIGPYKLDSQVILAPMAGITDQPFRRLCRKMGAGLTVTEMVSANPKLWHTRKSQQRMDHSGEQTPRSVQISGADPQMMADAAQFNVEHQAQIIDINMGCPAKKVCKKAAGSALLRDEKLVAEILNAVVSAVKVPVTLKIRTGWDKQQRNAVKIAQIAEQSGIQAIAVHGRTRACAYQGEAEYDTIAAVKRAVLIPVIANGDINSPLKAQQVLNYTGADGVMIGRAAQGRPWIFREINQLLCGEANTQYRIGTPDLEEQKNILLDHITELHSFYGSFLGPRIARKHVGWYLKQHDENGNYRACFNQLDETEQQLSSLTDYFHYLLNQQGNAA